MKIAEFLAGANSNNVSAKVDSSGWVLIIENRKLHAWKSSPTQLKKVVSSYEFQLPATDVPHKIALTCILESSVASTGKTSLICVSPGGVVRFWPNITQPAVIVETTLNISDVQCFAVESIMPYGCLLVTSNGVMYHLYPTNSTVNYQQVVMPTGMLSSLGKRVSSFWSQPVVPQNRYPPCVCNGTIDYDALQRYVVLTIDNKIQKWEFTGSSVGSATMVFEADLLTCINSYAGITEFSQEATVDDIQVVNMKNTGYGTVILCVLVIGETKTNVLGTFKSNISESSFSVENLVSIDYPVEVTCGDLQLVIPFGGYQAYISTGSMIISQPVSKSSRGAIKVEFKKANTGIIGGGSSGTDAVYLSLRDGLLTLKVTSVVEPILLDQTKVKFFNESSNGDIDIPEEKDSYSLIRSAFISHSLGKVQNILNLLSLLQTDTDLGDVLLKLSLEILDGYPPSDPRWTMSNPAFPPSSVLLLNQLRDKEKILDEFLNFLSIYELLDKVGNENLGVKVGLCESAEMLKCAIALVELPSHLASVVDEVINSSALDIQFEDSSANRKDSFFGKVSNVKTFFTTLAKVEEGKLSATQAIQEQVDTILNVSEIITSCFQCAWQYRQGSTYKNDLINQVPWTSSTGSGYRLLLKGQIQLVLSQALGNVDSTKAGTSLTRQVVLLSDLLFDGYLREIAALKDQGNEKDLHIVEETYNQERSKIIMTLVNLGYFAEATTLAEHYKDFQMLIYLCDTTNDKPKLKHYKTLFKNDGFSDVLYKWYVDKGEWGELMSSQDDVDNFDSMLSSHKQLSWLHFIGSKEYTKATSVLTQLAAEEKELSDRKKTMLVLANLSILAADEPANVIEEKMSIIDKQLDLLNYQDQVLKSLNMETINSVPLTAEELISLCLDDTVSNLTESQYVTLIELLQYVSSNRQDILLDIWKKSITQDTWEEAMNMDSVAVVSQKVFYKCLKYWKEKGEYSETIPLLNDLISKFTEKPDHLLFQLKVCYEALCLQELSVGA